jgi:hypothetical protein
VLIDADTLLGRLHERGRCELADGTPVTPETARRLACEADLLPVVLGGAGQPLDVGRSRRLATTHQRSAMLARCRTCEWPHCATPAAWCEAHHLQPWEHGGATDIDNLAWLCTAHHHLAHEGHWVLTRQTTGHLAATAPPATTGSPTDRQRRPRDFPPRDFPAPPARPRTSPPPSPAARHAA